MSVRAKNIHKSVLTRQTGVLQVLEARYIINPYAFPVGLAWVYGVWFGICKHFLFRMEENYERYSITGR